MKKILLIIKREFNTRVRKLSFIIMTILGPLLMAAIIIVPIFIAQMSDESKTIGVVDDTGLFYKRLPETNNLNFVYLSDKIIKAKKNITKNKYYAILHIPVDSADAVIPTSFFLYSDKQPSMIIKAYLENILKKDIESLKLEKSGIDKSILASIETNVNVATIKLKETGNEERSYSEMSTVLGFVAGFMIYIFIFMYGALVLRGVMEEKSNRIVEVIISSVKPFQLMMGKIVGVALVGLTQFLLWILLFFGIILFFQTSFPKLYETKQADKVLNVKSNNLLPDSSTLTKSTNKDSQIEINQVMEAIRSVNFGVMISAFIFYFLFGYLLYAALFAAIGAAVDNEADTQQFMLPITIPLLFSIIMIQFIINNPQGPVAFWLSMIPFTSPVIMMVRIPFGVPYSEIFLSIVLLILGFLATTWLAAKIYRTGILMYGKKVSYKELWKWLRY